MTDYTSKVFRETYRDFYDKEDGYHRVLYNAGRALQARELTESQRIIHEEIARFGQNIFKEGAMVNPGGATVDNGLEYIRLTSTSVYDESLIGELLTNGLVEFKILEMYNATGSDWQKYFMLSGTLKRISLAILKKWSTAFLLVRITAEYIEKSTF